MGYYGGSYRVKAQIKDVLSSGVEGEGFVPENFSYKFVKQSTWVLSLKYTY